MQNSAFSSKNTQNIFFPILISLISFFVYLNTLHHQFVFDEFTVIVNNPAIKEWKNFPKLFSSDYFSISRELSYRPLVTLSYFIDYSIWGLNPAGFHVTNVLIHMVNTPLIYYLIRSITRNNKIAIPASLFFCAHPILTETVNSIGFREDLLCSMFYLIALSFYVKVYTSKHKKTCYTISLTAYFFSLFSKEMALSLIIIIPILDWLFHQPGIRIKTTCLRYYPGFIGISVIYLLLRFIFLKSTLETISYPGNSIYINVLTMTKVLVSYVTLVFFPFLLNADYHVAWETSMRSTVFLISCILIISVIFIAFRVFKNQKEITFSILWFFVTLVPVMNVVPIGNLMAERYLYLPAIGFCLFLGTLLSKMHRTIHRFKPLLYYTSVLGITVIYIIFTIKQNRNWFDGETLWAYTVNNTSCSYNAHNNLGKIYFQKGLFNKAINEYNIALAKTQEIQYRYPTVHYNLGLAYGEKGMYQKAIQHYNETIKINNKDSEAHNNLGIMLFQTGQIDAAINELNTAIRCNPKNASYHYNLSRIYQLIDKPEEAKDEEELANSLRRRIKNGKAPDSG